jgi:hypothetical protein
MREREGERPAHYTKRKREGEERETESLSNGLANL